MQKAVRLKGEIPKLQKSPPLGTRCYVLNDQLDHLEFDINGPIDTPYSQGVFKLEMRVTDKYPFEPPAVKFKTKIYHPNIDTEGRVCLDLLKLPPGGTWRATYRIESLLIAIQSLMCTPNPDDPLIVEIGDEFRNNRDLFEQKAKEYTQKYAT